MCKLLKSVIGRRNDEAICFPYWIYLFSRDLGNIIKKGMHLS